LKLAEANSAAVLKDGVGVLVEQAAVMSEKVSDITHICLPKPQVSSLDAVSWATNLGLNCFCKNDRFLVF
jgi:hypothetical protein